MAKVTGPLLSLNASGTVGKALTYKQWKGINACSIKSRPSNPRTDDQMVGRAYFAAGGKITKVTDLTGDVCGFLKESAPAGQSWASAFIREIQGSNYANIIAAKTFYNDAGNSTIKGYFDAAALHSSIESVDLDGTSATQLSAGLILLAAYSASFRLGDPKAPTTVASVIESQVKAYETALTGVSYS